MATMPTAEDLILEVHHSLGIKQLPTKIKNDYRAFDLELENFREKRDKLLGEIFAALDLNHQARADARINHTEWISFHEELSQHIWTGAATQQQVTWHMLAYSYVPALARRVAFWNLAGVARSVPMDTGMPGGEFWFLPSIDPNSDTFKLPVAKVVDWLLDLVEPAKLEELNEAGIGCSPEIVRTLQNWRSGTSTPQSADKIDELFSDKVKLTFKGVLELDTGCSLTGKVDAALKFVERKNLATAELLHTQLPMTVSRLTGVLTGGAPEQEQEAFLYWLSLRYAQPTMKTIRQRLKVARMVQDGFERLMDFLVPGSTASCRSERLRLSRQLLGLFQTVYNLSVEAYQQAETDAQQDEWFEARLAPWDKADLLVSILPSLLGLGHVVVALLGERLTRRFMALAPDSPLPDLVAVDDSAASKEVVKQRLFMLKAEADEQKKLMALHQRMRSSSPWRALQQENDYDVVLQIAQDSNLSTRMSQLARDRCRALASSPSQQVEIAIVELTALFALPPQSRPEDIQERVETLLSQAEASSGYVLGKAPLLRWRGRHCLLQNDFGAAIEYHKAALQACKERQFGNLPGEIARDAWAIELAANGFIPNNQQRWYRHLLRDSRYIDVAKSPEDAAVWLWDEFLVPDLYQPYPAVERLQLNGSQDDWRFVRKALMGLSAKEDWLGLTAWLKRHSAKCRKMRLDPVRKNTVLMQWIKSIHGLKTQFRHEHALQSGVPSDAWEQQQTMLAGWQEALRLMIREWPEQARIADFKGQTPFMLVADAGDVELTRMLAPLSDVDAQDSLGRTALHAAVSSRSAQCVEIVLECAPLVADKVTHDERNTPLHTAVRFVSPKCVSLILDEYPSLASQKNVRDQYPLDMARDIHNNWLGKVEFMRGEGRATGSLQELETIVELLSAAQR